MLVSHMDIISPSRSGLVSNDKLVKARRLSLCASIVMISCFLLQYVDVHDQEASRTRELASVKSMFSRVYVAPDSEIHSKNVRKTLWSSNDSPGVLSALVAHGKREFEK
jgi:hypothetical protein